MNAGMRISKTVNLALGFLATNLVACGPSSFGTAGSAATGVTASGRLQVMSQPITMDTTGVSTNSVSSSGGVTAQDLLCTLLCFTPALTMIGTIAPPQVGGASLQASDVTVVGNRAYVAYNTAGAAQAGGIDVINISINGTPSLASSTTYATSDINKVYVDGNNSQLYLAGNTSDGATGAVLYRVGLDVNGLPTSTVQTKSLRSAADPTIPAYAGTSITKYGNYVYAVTGNNGGLSVLNSSDLSDAAFTAIPDARDVGLGISSNVIVVSGQTASTTAAVQSFATTTGALQASNTANTTFAGSTIDGAKSSIYAGTIGYVASGGQGGAKLLCYSGATVGTMSLPTGTGLANSDISANAVTFGNGLVYVAQGGAGVYVYAVQANLLIAGCAGYTLSYVGKFSLGSGASANNVYYSSGYLVLATGLGGFEIIQVTQSLVTGLLQVL